MSDSASYYTSYETSVALRDAGAPQDDFDHVWWISPRGPELTDFDDPYGKACGVAAAFRLDEILTALSRDAKRPDIRLSLDVAHNACNVEVRDDILPITSSVEGYGDTPVEAAADCWLDVLKIAAREREPK